jgi:serine/threonine-protein kinase
MLTAASFRLKHLCKSLLISFCLLTGSLEFAPRAQADSIDFSTYAAVAFSSSTGSYGYAWNYGTRGEAEQAALSRCTASDGRIVGWVQGGWLVLAIGENNLYGVGWEYGDGATNTVAEQRAINECHSRGDNVRTLICLCSGDIDPAVYK